MSTLRKIETASLKPLVGTLPASDCGPMPQLRFIEIDRLIVDSGYQRDIGPTGRRNILRIAREFEWARFSPVIVAPSKDRFVIVDGQHRTTAASLRGHKKVPCQIITADQHKQAAAFAAINANITKMSTMQLHAARVAANDPDALRLKKVCEAGGVTMLRYPVEAKKQKVGETMAVVQLRQALDHYGERALRLSLQCITRNGNPGMVRGLLVLAMCAVIEKNPKWLNNAELPATFSRFDFAQAFADAGRQAGGFSRAAFQTALAELIASFLSKQTGTMAA